MAKKSNFTIELELDWLSRIDIVKGGGTPEPIKQRNYYYLIRTITYQKYKEAPNTYEHFKYSSIYDLEDRYGYTREDLGITAKPDGVLYTRQFGTELIEYEHKLYPLICVIATEKSGIAESLSQYLLKYGIFVVDTTGMRGRYPNQYLMRIKAPKFCIEDYDITGCLMAKKFQEEAEIKPFSMLSLIEVLKREFNIKISVENVIEQDKSGKDNTHWNSISEKDRNFLYKDGKFWRIEIDTVMKFVKPDIFAKAVLYLLDKEIPIKDMSKVMELGEYVYLPLIPNKDKEELLKTIEKLEDRYKEDRQEVLNEYDGLEKDFDKLNLNVLEKEAKQKFQEIVGGDN